MKNLWNREPAMILSALGAAIALLVSFGLDLSDGQIGAITAFAAVVLGLITRSQVTPPAHLPPNDLPGGE